MNPSPANNNLIAKEPEMNWFYFHTYIRLPFGAMQTFGNSYSNYIRDLSFDISILFIMDIAVAILMLLTCVFLHQRKREGYLLNNFLLIYSGILPLWQLNYSLFIAALLFNIPTAIYFYKRRRLFQNGLLGENRIKTKYRNQFPSNVYIGEDNLPQQSHEKYKYGLDFTVLFPEESDVYHKPGCPELKGKKLRFAHVYRAMKKYTPCPICNPKSKVDEWWIRYSEIKEP